MLTLEPKSCNIHISLSDECNDTNLQKAHDIYIFLKTVYEAMSRTSLIKLNICWFGLEQPSLTSMLQLYKITANQSKVQIVITQYVIYIVHSSQASMMISSFQQKIECFYTHCV